MTGEERGVHPHSYTRAAKLQEPSEGFLSSWYDNSQLLLCKIENLPKVSPWFSVCAGTTVFDLMNLSLAYPAKKRDA